MWVRGARPALAATSLVATLLTAGCGRDPLDLPNARTTAGTTVVFLGDSLTAGHRLAAGERFTDLLAADLPMEVVNAGKSGDTTGDALARFDRDVAAADPAVVVVLLGGNDFLQGRPRTLAERDYDAILRRVVEVGAVPVAIAFETGLFGDGYTGFIDDVAGRHGAWVLEDILDDVLRDPSRKLDRIHPNAAGHADIADRLREPLETLVRAIAGR